jgi:hypothetical protein
MVPFLKYKKMQKKYIFLTVFLIWSFSYSYSWNPDDTEAQHPTLLPTLSHSSDRENLLPFTPSQILEIRRVSLEIYKQTTSSDVIVFLGRSPLWLADYWEYMGIDDRTFFSLAFSGQPYKAKLLFSNPSYIEEEGLIYSSKKSHLPDAFPSVNIPTLGQLNGYANYLYEIGFMAALANLHGKLIVVDFAISGGAICGFHKTLEGIPEKKFIAKALRNFQFYLLTHVALLEALEQTKSSARQLRIYFPIRPFLMDQGTLVSISNEKDNHSLGMHFPYWQWDKMNPLEHKSHSDALKRQTQIHTFWEQL